MTEDGHQGTTSHSAIVVEKLATLKINVDKERKSSVSDVATKDTSRSIASTTIVTPIDTHRNLPMRMWPNLTWIELIFS